jgi:hypothetical protein
MLYLLIILVSLSLSWTPTYSFFYVSSTALPIKRSKRQASASSSNDMIIKLQSNKDHYIDDSIFQDIESSLLNAIGSMTISTSAYYCDELQKHGFSSNIVNKNWMLCHQQYKMNWIRGAVKRLLQKHIMITWAR